MCCSKRPQSPLCSSFIEIPEALSGVATITFCKLPIRISSHESALRTPLVMLKVGHELDGGGPTYVSSPGADGPLFVIEHHEPVSISPTYHTEGGFAWPRAPEQDAEVSLVFYSQPRDMTLPNVRKSDSCCSKSRGKQWGKVSVRSGKVTAGHKTVEKALWA